ncbi:MAG: hypothetical protein J6N72_02810 [Psychrobacter sp.]|nr:hypothetical protein [Psychrobacter sp.]
MKINQNIAELAIESGYSSEWAHQQLQYMWNNRKKPQLFIVNIHSVSKSGMSRKLKLGMIYNGAFVDVTRLVAEITDNKFDQKNYALTIEGGGMDMIFALLESLYSRLSSKKDGNAYRLNAVQSYVLF